MRKFLGWLLIAWVLLGSVSWTGATELADNQHVGTYSTDVEEVWKWTLHEKGLQEGGANGRNIFVSHGKTWVRRALDHPGFHASRAVAYDIAYLRAKAELVRSLTTTMELTSSFQALENARWSDGQGEVIEGLKQTDRIHKKRQDLTEAELDQELAKIDSNYDPGKYDGRKEKEKAVRIAFRQKLREAASNFISGALPLMVLEGPEEDGYQVLVGLVWSPRLERAARAITDGRVPRNNGEIGVRIADWLPKHEAAIVASWGVHKLTDEHGDQVFIGFGQAAPRTASPSLRRDAEEFAMLRAELRARGAIRRFVGEVVTSGASLADNEIQDAYASRDPEVTNSSETVARLNSRAEAVTLTGLSIARRWLLPHPANGQPVAVVAVSWSPTGLATVKRVQDAMREARGPQPTEKTLKAQQGRTKVLRRENVQMKDL